MESFRGEIVGQDRFNYVLAGDSIFTVKNEESGNRMTFRVTSLQRIDKESTRRLWFVKVLAGPDNIKDYSFLGSLQGKDDGQIFYKHSPKSKVTEGAQSVKVIDWFVKKLQDGKMPASIKMYHEGFCGRCGRRLTVPESIQNGYGPECLDKMGL